MITTCINHSLKVPALVCFITYNLLLLNLKVLYIALIRSRFDYASAASNHLILADLNKQANIQRKFASLCYNRFIHSDFPGNSYSVSATEHSIPDNSMLHFLPKFSKT
jgi:hypothetical protein